MQSKIVRLEHTEIRGKNAFPEYTKSRTACRGVVLQDGALLLSYETKTGLWMLPGGGLEPNETNEECCVRELCEETGYIVSPVECFLQLNEFYEEWKFVSYFYLCKPVGMGARKPSARELRVGMEPRWVAFDEALSIFSRHADFDGVDEEKRGIYQREYEALLSCKRAYIL